MKIIQTHSEYSWSLLDPRPVVKYVDFLDEYIVYWNGVVMTHMMAMNIAMEMFKVYPSPSMRTRLLSNYKRVFYANGFGEMPKNWEDAINTGRIYSYLRNKLHPHMRETMKNYSHADILGWFDYKRARITDVSIDTVA